MKVLVVHYRIPCGGVCIHVCGRRCVYSIPGPDYPGVDYDNVEYAAARFWIKPWRKWEGQVYWRH